VRPNLFAGKGFHGFLKISTFWFWLCQVRSKDVRLIMTEWIGSRILVSSIRGRCASAQMEDQIEIELLESGKDFLSKLRSLHKSLAAPLEASFWKLLITPPSHYALLKGND
jgi:hypothetical protein